jgi:hypothetical protein
MVFFCLFLAQYEDACSSSLASITSDQYIDSSHSGLTFTSDDKVHVSSDKPVALILYNHIMDSCFIEQDFTHPACR